MPTRVVHYGTDGDRRMENIPLCFQGPLQMFFHSKFVLYIQSVIQYIQILIVFINFPGMTIIFIWNIGPLKM